MQVDLTSSEISLLGIACDEEVLYYGRCVMRDGTLNATHDNIDWGPNRKLGELAPDERTAKIEIEMQKAVNKNIRIYSELSTQLKKHNTNFSMEQIQHIKHMIHDMPLQFSKHIVVKRQIDDTVSFNYVNKLMEVALESAKAMYLKEYSDIEKKLDGAN